MATQESSLRDTTKAATASPPWLLKFRSSTGFILLTVCLSIFTDGFLYGFIVPVLPFTLTQRSGIPESEVPYWTSLLFAVFGGAILVGSPIFGWFADQSASRRWPLLVGLGILALATLMFAGGKNIWVLAASRMLQGFSAANVYTIGLALLTDTVGRDEVGQMMGFALSSANVGVLISPLLGGLVYARAGYIPLFGMALGLICFDIFLRLVMIEKKVAAKYMLPAEENGRYGTFGDGQPTEADRSCDVQQPPDTGAHPSTEDTQNGHVGNGPSDEEHQPLLKKDGPRKSRFNFKTPTVFILLRSPRMLTAILGIFVEVGILSSFDTVLPLFVKRTFGWDSLQAGLIFLCIAAPSLSGPLVGKLSDRYGPRWVAVTGLLATLPFLVMLRLVDHHSTGQIVLLCTLLSLIGLFLTFVMSPLAADLAGLVEEREKEQPGIFGPYGAYAQVFAVFNCSMAAGTLAFPIWAGFAQATFGWKTMAWSLGLTCGVAAIPVMIFTGGTITKRSKPAMFEREHEGTV